MSPVDTRIPVIVLTGFLGSGKTTLLQQLLRRPGWQHTAVVINELGEMGLDHLLVQHVAPHVQVLPNGCVCCTVSEDLVVTLEDLHQRHRTGEVHLRQVVVETTGLADPQPLLHTLSTHPALARCFRLSGVVTTVDAFQGSATLARHAEARHQVAVADTLLLTKTDLAADAICRELEQRLEQINPTAQLHRVLHGQLPHPQLLGSAHWASGLQKAWERRPGRGWLLQGSATGSITAAPLAQAATARLSTPHATDITTECLAVQQPLQVEALTHWLELLTALRGDCLLRLKGLVHVAEEPHRPLVVHAAQHLLHAPERLPRWPGSERRSLLVFITQGMEPGLIARTFQKFTGAQAFAASFH